ncbi:MAG: carbon-nitrogen family hydrolase [Planctomycetes bacterium]|nr:carbon-nitrogen family hydrolase [Planctomycetota bacterium]
MNIVGVQTDMVWEDKQANFTKVRSLLDNTTIPPDSLIVLPEMFATGFSMNTSEIQEQTEGLTDHFLKDLSRQYQASTIGGVVRQDDGKKPRNEAVAFNDQGQEVARYCKLHPFSLGKETDHYERGRDIVTFAWGAFSVGLFICYDLRFPEVFRASVGRGADLLVVIACWPITRKHHWATLLRARAIENQAYVVGINRCGADPYLTYGGESVLVDPRGTVLAEADDQESVLLGSVDPTVIADCRRELPCLQDRHPDYGVF